jgi:hypothetical protein
MKIELNENAMFAIIAICVTVAISTIAIALSFGNPTPDLTIPNDVEPEVKIAIVENWARAVEALND